MRAKMDSVKKPIKYGIWILLFFIFSNILIECCLATNYSKIERKDKLTQIQITTAEATKVNGRIIGKISNSSEDKIQGDYIKIDFYSKRNILLGTKYIDISTIAENETRDLELHFKLQDVEYYNISFTNEKPEQGDLELLPQDLTREQIFWGTIFAVIIFW